MECLFRESPSKTPPCRRQQLQLVAAHTRRMRNVNGVRKKRWHTTCSKAGGALSMATSEIDKFRLQLIDILKRVGRKQTFR